MSTSTSDITIPQDYQARADLLTNRVILITGASDGIGAAAAHYFADHGATVILHGRSLPKLEAIYDGIEVRGGARPAIVPLDLATATPADYQQIAHHIEQEFGRLDGLLHSAGVLGDITPIEQYSLESWDRVMNINVRAAFLLTQSLLPALKMSVDASVLFTSSSVGQRARAYWGAYAVSKFATEGLAQLLADELKNTSHIRVNCINPGATRTAMRAQAYPGENPDTLKSADALMPLYSYLMGPDSKGLTGHRIDAADYVSNASA